MFKNTPNFQNAVSIINNLDTSKIRTFLITVMDARKKQTTSTLFTDSDYESIQEIFQLNPKDVRLLVDASVYVFEQALYNSINVDNLYKELIEVGMEENVAKTFALVWRDQGRDYLTKMKDKTLGGPITLKDVNWRLQLKVSDDTTAKQKQPHALFEFTLGREEEFKEEKLVVEFNHPQLFEFFTKLEKIQSQLDALT